MRTWLSRLLLVLVSLATSRAAANDDARFLDGLRARRLFTLAEKFCEDRLADPQLSPAARVDTLAELSQTRVEAALQAPADRRAEAWQRALQTTSDYLAAHPDEARRLLLDIQTALVHLSHGRQARQQSELVADREAWLSEARDELRLAIEQLRAATEQATRVRRDLQLMPPSHHAWTIEEFLPLERNVRYQLALALREQGETYPPRSPDRIAALDQALEILKPLAELDAIDPLSWQARIDQIACARLIGDGAEAARRLTELEQQKPPTEIALAARAERIRLLLAENRVGEAITTMELGREIDKQTSPELDYTILETLVAAWREAAREQLTSEAQRRQQQAIEMIATIDALYGPYWSRRAEMLVAGNVSASPATNDLALLTRSAEGFYRAGQVDEALAAYDRVFDTATTQARPEDGFGAAFTAAAIEQQRGRHAEAANRFLALVASLPQHPRAGEGHLLAIFNFAQTMKPDDALAAAKYRGLLEQHVKQFATEASVEQARLWLGRLEQSEQRWAEAVAQYRLIARASPHFAAAIAGLAECYGPWLAAERQAGRSPANIAAEAAQFLEQVIGADGVLPARWSPQEQQAGLEAARLWLDDTEHNEARAERILAAALAGSPEAPVAWQQRARALLVTAIAAQGRDQEAAAAIESLRGADPALGAQLVQRLVSRAQQASPPLKTSLAELAVHAAGVFHDSLAAMSSEDRRQFELARATALMEAGRTADAQRAFAELARSNPKDAGVQERYAQLLSSSNDRDTLEAALEQWRGVEQRSKPQSDLWFRAKYAVALLHQRLGRPERALEIIDVTALLHPELGGPEMKSKFLALRERVKSN